MVQLTRKAATSRHGIPVSSRLDRYLTQEVDPVTTTMKEVQTDGVVRWVSEAESAKEKQRRRGLAPGAQLIVAEAKIQTMVALFQMVQLFADIDVRTLQKLAQSAVEYMVKPHQAVLKQNDAATPSMFVVVSGKLEAWLNGHKTVHSYERGDYVGERAFAQVHARGACVRGGADKSTIVQLFFEDLALASPITFDRVQALNSVVVSPGSRQNEKSVGKFLKMRMVRCLLLFAACMAVLTRACLRSNRRTWWVTMIRVPWHRFETFHRCGLSGM